MLDILVKPEDEIQIAFVICKNKHGAIFAENSKDALKEMHVNDEIDETTIEDHEVSFRLPSFKDSVDLSSQFSIAGEEGGLAFNPLATRFQKIKKLIKRWTFKDVEGKPIPVNAQTIAQMHPVIMNHVGARLDEQTPIL